MVFVAGASGGIGMAASKMLLERGARVALHYRSRAEGLEGLLQEYGAEKVVLVKADLTRRDEVESAVAEALKRFGKLDAFLSTVGTALRIKPFLDTPDDLVDLTIATELRSAITIIRAVLPRIDSA